MRDVSPLRGRLIWLLVCLTTMPATAIGQEKAEPEALSLEQVLRIAYLNNPTLLEARREVSAAKARRFEVEMPPDPEAEFDAGGLKAQTRENKTFRSGHFDGFSIKQPLDPLGTRFLRGRMAADETRIASGELLRAWADVRKQVISLYADILAGDTARDVAHDGLEATRQFLGRVETRFQSGKALRSDVLRAKIEVTRAQNEVLVNEKESKVLRGQMNLLLGRSIESPLVLSESLTYDALHYQYQQIRTKALANRPDVRNETIRLAQRRKGVWQAVLTTLFPRMALGVQRSTQSFQNDTTLLVTASYPLWGFNLGAVREAQALREKQVIHLAAVKNEADLEIYQAFLEAELADRQVALQKESLEEANELLRQVTMKYEEGEVPFLTYLDNIKTIKETRLAYFTALKNYRGKVAELEQAIQAAPVPSGLR